MPYAENCKYPTKLNEKGINLEKVKEIVVEKTKKKKSKIIAFQFIFPFSLVYFSRIFFKKFAKNSNY